MTFAFQLTMLALVNITLQECTVICVHLHFTTSQLASLVIAKERVLRQTYVTKKQEIVNVNKVLLDQTVVNALLAFTIILFVLDVRVVLWVPLRMFVIQRQGSAIVRTDMKELLVTLVKTDTMAFLNVKLAIAHHLEARITTVTGEVENALASLTIAEITANNVLPIIMATQSASNANVM